MKRTSLIILKQLFIKSQLWVTLQGILHMLSTLIFTIPHMVDRVSLVSSSETKNREVLNELFKFTQLIIQRGRTSKQSGSKVHDLNCFPVLPPCKLMRLVWVRWDRSQGDAGGDKSPCTQPAGAGGTSWVSRRTNRQPSLLLPTLTRNTLHDNLSSSNKPRNDWKLI